LPNRRIVNGDPTKDIADLRRVALVLTQGQWISPKELHGALRRIAFDVRPLTPDMRQLCSNVFA
jgi:hypothetical protein